jgi:uncharacterized protein YkwD
MLKQFLTAGSVLAALMLSLASVAKACEAVETLQADSAEEFALLEAATAPIDFENVDYSLLAEAIFHETNLRRQGNERQALGHLIELDQAACVYAQDMVEGNFFAHRNPNDPEKETPFDRVESQGLEVGFVAENIAQTFALQYESGTSVYTRQENGETVFSREAGGEPLPPHTYQSFVTDLLDQWMDSPGHRRNTLAEEPRYLGAGCEDMEDGELGMPIFTCVQLFFDHLEAP